MIRVAVKGGILAIADLRKLVEWCLGRDIQRIIPGMRQELLIPDAHPSDAGSLVRAGLELMQDGQYNLMSSLPALGLEPGTSWLSHTVYRRVLDELPSQAPIRIQIADPLQGLFTGLSSDLAFFANEKRDVWNIYLFDPLENALRILPATCATHKISEIARFFCETRPSFIESAAALSDDLGLSISNPVHEYRPIRTRDFEGFHRDERGTDERGWLGIASEGIFSTLFLQQMQPLPENPRQAICI